LPPSPAIFPTIVSFLRDTASQTGSDPLSEDQAPGNSESPPQIPPNLAQQHSLELNPEHKRLPFQVNPHFSMQR
jgi:hypothetical protein